MMLWMETFGVLALACVGVILGTMASRSGVFSRTAAMGVTFVLVGLVLAGRFEGLVYRWPSLMPLAAGRVRFVLLILAVTLGLTTPLTHLTHSLTRLITCVIMAVYVSALVILPFLSPAAGQGQLSSLQARFDNNGVCRQSMPFTCGSAAAVTALRHLGIEAEKGPLAVAARTSPFVGVSPWNLYRVLDRQYSAKGLHSSYSYFETPADVPQGAVLLAVMRDSAWGDHCVAVLEITAVDVLIADPATGLHRVSTEAFMRTWRRSGIVLRRAV